MAFENAGCSLLAQTVLGSAAASIDVQDIPQTFENLRIIIMGRGDDTTRSDKIIDVLVRLNNDSGANYDWMIAYAVGTTFGTVTSAAATSALMASLTNGNATANQVGMAEIIIPDYARTTFNKVLRANDNRWVSTTTSAFAIEQKSGQWRSTAAVTRVTVLASVGNFAAGTALSIYGGR